ncbi:MAG: hypothetical protein ACRC8O_12675, partial [Plesiomonas shigelloides]
GRLATVDEIEYLKKHENLCRDVLSPHAIWKVDGNDGNIWQFMGYSYQCETKAGGNPWSESICVMKDTPSYSATHIYSNYDFKGRNPWDGKAVVNSVGDVVNVASVKSFKLGENTQLTAYSEENFSGERVVYKTSMPKTNFEIKSYKVSAINSDDTLNYRLTSNVNYKVCLQMKTQDDSSSICSDEQVNIKPLLKLPADGQVNIATFISAYKTPNNPDVNVGQVVLDVKSGSASISHQVSPDNINVNIKDNTLSFTYN